VEKKKVVYWSPHKNKQTPVPPSTGLKQTPVPPLEKRSQCPPKKKHKKKKKPKSQRPVTSPLKKTGPRASQKKTYTKLLFWRIRMFHILADMFDGFFFLKHLVVFGILYFLLILL
jgi:hypothetical protein